MTSLSSQIKLNALQATYYTFSIFRRSTVLGTSRKEIDQHQLFPSKALYRRLLGKKLPQFYSSL